MTSFSNRKTNHQNSIQKYRQRLRTSSGQHNSQQLFKCSSKQLESGKKDQLNESVIVQTAKKGDNKLNQAEQSQPRSVSKNGMSTYKKLNFSQRNKTVRNYTQADGIYRKSKQKQESLRGNLRNSCFKNSTVEVKWKDSRVIKADRSNQAILSIDTSLSRYTRPHLTPKRMHNTNLSSLQESKMATFPSKEQNDPKKKKKIVVTKKKIQFTLFKKQQPSHHKAAMNEGKQITDPQKGKANLQAQRNRARSRSFAKIQQLIDDLSRKRNTNVSGSQSKQKNKSRRKSPHQSIDLCVGTCIYRKPNPVHEAVLTKLKQFSFIESYISQQDIIEQFYGFELSNEPESKWALLIIDLVYTKIKGVASQEGFHLHSAAV